MTGLEHSEFGVLLDRYENNEPNAIRKLLQYREATPGEIFLSEVRNALLHRPATAGVGFATTLLDSENTLRILLEIYVDSKQQAIDLVKKLLVCDPRFDNVLLDCIRDNRMADRSENAVLIVLDILDEISEGDKLVLSVSRLLKHPNAKLRSKAASFIARRRPQVPWVSDLSNEKDARVRANVVESLHQMKGDLVAPLLRKHVADENNRVSGNALLGLYRAGDPGAIRLIDEMSKDARPLFRLTSAWVMGQTGDPRFAANLAAQLSDTDALIRNQALRGLGRIKDALKRSYQANELQIAVLKQQANRTANSLVVSVTNESGESVRNIPGTHFVLKASGNFVRSYDVNEQEFDGAIHVAFVLCLPASQDAALNAEFEKATDACGSIRRGRDVMTVSKLTHDAQLRCVQEDPALAVAALRDALVDVPLALPNLHLVVIGAGPETSALDAILKATADLKAVVHVIALSPDWCEPEFRGKLEMNEGFFRCIEQARDLEQACADYYRGLQHRYCLTWEQGEGSLDLDVRGEFGVGSVSCESVAAPVA